MAERRNIRRGRNFDLELVQLFPLSGLFIVLALAIPLTSRYYYDQAELSVPLEEETTQVASREAEKSSRLLNRKGTDGESPQRSL